MSILPEDGNRVGMKGEPLTQVASSKSGEGKTNNEAQAGDHRATGAQESSGVSTSFWLSLMYRSNF